MRRPKALSQKELGDEILYSRSVISRLETEPVSSGDVHPRLKANLEQFFGHPLEYLLAPVTVPERADADGRNERSAHI